MESKKTIQEAIRGDLFYIVVYHWGGSSYSDILHYSEICTDTETINTVSKVIPIKKDIHLKPITGSKAQTIIKTLSDWNAKQIKKSPKI